MERGVSDQLTGGITDMGNKAMYGVLIFVILEALLMHLRATDGLLMPLVIRVLGSFWALPV